MTIELESTRKHIFGESSPQTRTVERDGSQSRAEPKSGFTIASCLTLVKHCKLSVLASCLSKGDGNDPFPGPMKEAPRRGQSVVLAKHTSSSLKPPVPCCWTASTLMEVAVRGSWI